MGTASTQRCLPGLDGIPPQTLPTTEPEHAQGTGQTTQATEVPIPQDLLLGKPQKNLQLNEGVRRLGCDNMPGFTAPHFPTM